MGWGAGTKCFGIGPWISRASSKCFADISLYVTPPPPLFVLLLQYRQHMSSILLVRWTLLTSLDRYDLSAKIFRFVLTEYTFYTSGKANSANIYLRDL